ncbi:MAG: hypothetical protein DMG07_18025, partial [Acidobacteria bacterium]
MSFPVTGTNSTGRHPRVPRRHRMTPAPASWCGIAEYPKARHSAALNRRASTRPADIASNRSSPSGTALVTPALVTVQPAIRSDAASRSVAGTRKVRPSYAYWESSKYSWRSESRNGRIPCRSGTPAAPAP